MSGSNISTISGGEPYSYRTLHTLYQEVVSRYPEAVALRYTDKSYTYAEVSLEIEAYVATLQALGMRCGDVIGLHIPRSDRYVMLTMAIMIGGFIYLPLPVELPFGRLEEYTNVAKPRMIVTEQWGGPHAEGVHYAQPADLYTDAPRSEALLCPMMREAELCYIIFTSGSEGRPKGVKITHGGFINRLLWARDYYKLDKGDVLISRTPLTFDPSIQELVLPFLTGGCLLVASAASSVLPNHLIDAIVKFRVTMMIVVPTLLRQILEIPKFSECRSLRHVVCCGEPWSADLITKFHSASENGKIYNGYGPTETTIGALVYCAYRNYERSFIPIGRPIKGVCIALVGDDGKNVASDEVGELIIGGICVGDGYIAAEALNKAKFKSLNVEGLGETRFYFTGDLAKQLPCGDILFVGRKDNQVKINGVRVELEEIENIIKRHHAVDNAVAVKASDDHGDSIHVFFTSNVESLDAPVLLTHCEKWLGRQMLPSTFAQVGQLPLTHNGKVDRKKVTSMLVPAARLL